MINPNKFNDSSELLPNLYPPEDVAYEMSLPLRDILARDEGDEGSQIEDECEED